MPDKNLKKVDFEPYFLKWDSVMFYPDPSKNDNQIVIANYAGDGGVIPCHRHQTCLGLVNATTKYPPRVCPICHVDTSTELTEEERGFDPGAVNLIAVRTT